MFVNKWLSRKSFLNELDNVLQRPEPKESIDIEMYNQTTNNIDEKLKNIDDLENKLNQKVEELDCLKKNVQNELNEITNQQSKIDSLVSSQEFVSKQYDEYKNEHFE